MKHFFITVISLLLLLEGTAAAAQNARSSQSISNQHVTCITADKNGYMWIGTLDGLNKYNGMEFISYFASLSNNGNQVSSGTSILTVCIDSKGRTWAGTPMGFKVAADGKTLHSSSTGISPVNVIRELDESNMLVAFDFKLSKVDSDTYEEIAYYPKHAICLEVSSLKEIWAVVHENGRQVIKVLSPAFEELHTIPLAPGVKIKGSLQTEDGMIWFYSDSEIFTYNGPSHSEVRRDTQAFKDGNIQFVVPYKSGSLLVGISGTGLFSFNTYTGEATRVFHDEHLEDKESVAYVDANSSVWLSDAVDVIKIYHDTRLFYPLYHFLDRIESNFIESIQLDNQNHLWCIVDSDLMSINLEDGKIISLLQNNSYSHLIIDKNGRLWFKENDFTLKRHTLESGRLGNGNSYNFTQPIISVIMDGEGTIWAQFSDHLAYLDENGSFKNLPLPQSDNLLNLICCDGSGELMMTSKDGLFILGKDRQFTRLTAHNLDFPLSAARDSEGDYWVGTTKGLVKYSPSTSQIKRFDIADGVPASMIQATMLGQDGNIWIVLENDIIRFDKKLGTFSHYVDRRFSKNKHFLTNKTAAASDGTFFIASTSGIIALNPGDVPSHYERPFELKRIKVGMNTFLEPQPSCTFKHSQNDLIFWCNTSDPAYGFNIEYRHFLEGYDESWSQEVTNGWISYEDLPAGDYIFHAMVRNGDGTWSTNTIDFPFSIKRHPLLSAFAIILYLIFGASLLGGLLYLIIHLRIRRASLEFAAQRETMAKQHIDYLTDISHELRLPLTLIYAPVLELGKSTNLNERESDLMKLIEHNVGRMKTLTEQILDSGKYTEEKNNLKVASYNVGQIIRMVTGNYRFLALEKDISLTVDVPNDLDCWMDFEKVVKILNNLISNAIKYTPNGGRILVDCQLVSDEGRLSINVTDNGIGIPQDKRSLIFNRFERLDYDSSKPHTEGSGVGLNYAQKLAMIHKGIITYYPVESGGSCFNLTIPAVKAAYSENEIVNLSMPYLSSEVFIHNNSTGDIKDKSVLIAEDDYELLLYLETLFSSEWNVIGANNGLEAMDSILQSVPDLVISDVSMPRKDGFELCKEIKNNDDLSHIPVVLLTALGDVENSITGLESGCDSYITKPFDPYYLLAECKTLVKNRKKLQLKVSNLTSSTIGQQMDRDEPLLKESDKQFIDKLHSIIDAHLNEEGFNASSLAKEMNNSYSNFYIKLKNLTGQSPQVYLNTYKMNVAMELLKSGAHNVGEVAFMTGFSAISNFSRSFKKQFGITPSEVK